MTPENAESDASGDAELTGTNTQAPEQNGAHAPDESHEQAPSEQGMVEADDLFVTRDPDTDELLPTRVTIPGFGDAKIRQLNYGKAEEFFGDAGAVADVGPAVIAEILREQVVEPDLEQFCREQYGDKIRRNTRGDTNGPPPFLNDYVVREEMKPFVPLSFLRAIMNESGLPTSGIRMNDDGSATINFDESAQGNR